LNLKIIDSLIQSFMNMIGINHFRFFLLFSLVMHIKVHWSESHNYIICKYSILF
jgi:hypothetical protein